MTAPAPAPMIVQLTVPQLRELVREEVRDALATHQAPAESDWLDATAAALHLGICVRTLRKLYPPDGGTGTRPRWRRSSLDSRSEGRRLRVAR